MACWNRARSRTPDDDLGQGYDGALLLNVIHAHSPEDNLLLLKRIAGSLRPKGRVMILDQMDDKALSPTARGVLRILAMAYFVGLGGQTFAYDKVKGWLDSKLPSCLVPLLRLHSNLL
jgi:hypothetical protein